MLDDEQRALVAMVREFTAAEVVPVVRDYEDRAEDPRPLYQKLAELSLTGIPFPEGFGGMGTSYGTYLLVVEELAAAYLSLAIGLSVHTLCAFSINEFGNDSQRKELLAKLASGEWFGAYSLSEPGAGSDAASLTTKATRDGDMYVLNGSKAFCTRGNEADVILMMARTSEEGAAGVTAFLLRKGTAGFTGIKKEEKMGWRSSPTWMLGLDDVRLGEEDRLGEEGQGFRIAMASLDSGRLGIAACGVGLAQAALDAAIWFTTEREQFGHPVAEQEGVRFMLADMGTSIEAARRLYKHAAALRDAGEDYSLQAAQAKLFATDVAMKVTIDAVQLHGGYGYVTEYPVERYLREAKGLQIVEGTNQIQRYVIGRKLIAD
jgi:alkylation response protein AidB-like acyl-CoA dehydrogenase